MGRMLMVTVTVVRKLDTYFAKLEAKACYLKPQRASPDCMRVHHLKYVI